MFVLSFVYIFRVEIMCQSFKYIGDWTGMELKIGQFWKLPSSFQEKKTVCSFITRFQRHLFLVVSL